MTFADIAVIVATLLAWTSLVPQIVRLGRTGNANGVSTTWPAIGLVSNAAWTAYILSQELWAAAPSTAVMVIFYLLVFRALAGTGVRLGRPIARGVMWTLILAGTGIIGGWSALGLLLGWSYVIQLAPAVWSVYRTDRPTGVSAPTWILIVVEALLWGFYGWWFSDIPIIVYAAVGVVAGCTILVRLGALTWRSGRQVAATSSASHIR